MYNHNLPGPDEIVIQKSLDVQKNSQVITPITNCQNTYNFRKIVLLGYFGN